MYSIGEFSKITSLTVKSLRLYHDKGLLVPARVDDFTGYRYYDNANYETARSIKMLKDFDFSLAEIKEILDEYEDEGDMVTQLKLKLQQVRGKMKRYDEISHSLELLIQSEKERTMEDHQQFDIEEKVIETILIAGYRMRGKYEDIGKGMGLLFKKVGRHVNGKPLALYFDGEYKEDDADFEACVPVRKGQSDGEITVRELTGGKCVTLIHKGPYDALHSSYKKIYDYLSAKGYTSKLPTREVYVKGPGMIFKGNPRNYLTEIQIMIED
ncbi:MAG: MerR family transcriptional regulator [Candidatus Zhuqueibacterota bacterium]